MLGDPNVERALVGAIIVSPGILPEIIPLVDQDAFVDSDAKATYMAILEMHQQGQKIDVVTVAHRLATAMPKVLEKLATWTADVPAVEGSKDYAKIVADLAAKRRIAAELVTYQNVLTTSHDGLESAPEVARRIIQLLPDSAQRKPITAAEVVKREQARYEEDRTAPDTTSGIEPLDHLMNFYRHGDLTIIAGRPSMGKTTLAKQLVRLNSEKVTHLIYSLEDEPMMFLDGMACSMAQVNTERFWNAYATQEEDNRVFSERLRLMERPIYFYPSYNVSAALIRAHVELLKHKHERIAVVIDYVQQMEHPREKGETLAAAIGHTSRILKLTALEYKVPVILLAQLNREAEDNDDGRPELKNLKDCGGLEQDADNVVFVFYRQKTENKRRIRVAKRRRGRCEELKGVSFLQELGIFTKLDPQEYPPYDFEGDAKTPAAEPKKARRTDDRDYTESSAKKDDEELGF